MIDYTGHQAERLSFVDWNTRNVKEPRPQPAYVAPTMADLLAEYRQADEAYEAATDARQRIVEAIATVRAKHSELEASIATLTSAWADAVLTPEQGSARLALHRAKDELAITREELEVLAEREKMLPDNDAALWAHVQRKQEAVYRAVTVAEIATLPTEALSILQQAYVVARASGISGSWGDWLESVLPAPPVTNETMHAVLAKHEVTFD